MSKYICSIKASVRHIITINKYQYCYRMIEVGPKARNEVVVSLKLEPCALPRLSPSPLHPTASTCALP